MASNSFRRCGCSLKVNFFVNALKVTIQIVTDEKCCRIQRMSFAKLIALFKVAALTKMLCWRINFIFC